MAQYLPAYTLHVTHIPYTVELPPPFVGDILIPKQFKELKSPHSSSAASITQLLPSTMKILDTGAHDQLSDAEQRDTRGGSRCRDAELSKE